MRFWATSHLATDRWPGIQLDLSRISARSSRWCSDLSLGQHDACSEETKGQISEAREQARRDQSNRDRGCKIRYNHCLKLGSPDWMIDFSHPWFIRGGSSASGHDHPGIPPKWTVDLIGATYNAANTKKSRWWERNRNTLYLNVLQSKG